MTFVGTSTEPRLFVVTGIMASGKSTVAQLLAERFTRSAHVRGDTFRRFVVSGRHEMSSTPTAEALAQLQLRYESAAACADSYVTAGFTTIVQDNIFGPALTDFLAMLKTRPLSLVVLSPSVEEVEQREAGRGKRGYGAFSPADLDAVLRNTTPRIGLWVDSTGQTPAETVDEILRRTEESLIRLL